MAFPARMLPGRSGIHVAAQLAAGVQESSAFATGAQLPAGGIDGNFSPS